MYFKQIKVGEYDNFCYIIADIKTKKCAIIDPSFNPEEVIAEVSANGFHTVYIINTHDHRDHTAGNEAVIKAADDKVEIVLHSSSIKADIKVNDGDKLSLGDLSLEIIHTPGHTKDSICILVEGQLVTGDTLFVGKVGGTNSREAALQEFASLTKLMALDDKIVVWPGHDYGNKLSSTVKEERESNPFCRRLDNFEKFYRLKENWLTYKQKHGIS